MSKKINLRKILAVSLSLLMAQSALVLNASADAGEAPPPIKDGEQQFPDPSSFSYDDVEVDFAKALQYSLYFYDANKCGSGISGGNLEWRGDCHVEDYKIPLQPMEIVNPQKCMHIGTNLSQEFIDKYKDIIDPDGDGYVDCGGGMHDAGDHVKFGLPGSYAASTVGWGYYEFRDAYKETGNQEHVEDILHWFNDFYMKSTYLDEDGKVVAFCYQVGEGDNDHCYWNPPELQDAEHLDDFARPAYFATVDTPATDMCAGTAASLAINYLNFKDTEPEYAKESLEKAIALYDFAVETHIADGIDDTASLGYDGGFYKSSYAWDELSWAAVWLYECTQNHDYIDDIISVSDTPNENGSYDYTGYMKRIIVDTGNIWQNIWVHCWDTVWGGVFAKLAPITNTARDWYIYRWNLEFWSGLQHTYAGAPAEFLWNKEYEYTSEPDSCTDHLAQSPSGYSMLNNYGSARYNTAAQLCAMVYRKETAARGEEDPQFTDWSKEQMEYLMGKNPMDRCYIVGYADNSASHPHHRAAHASRTLSMDDPVDDTHVLWGALVGGPDIADWHRDLTADYIYNEVSVDYNAGFVGACAGLYYYYGDDTMKNEENFPPKEENTGEFKVEALINQENKERTQYTVKISNAQTTPPAYICGFKSRYYFNISELLAKGQTIDDVTVEVYYDQIDMDTKGEYSVTVSDPIKVDEENYYVEMDWGNYKFYGTRELQLGIIAAQDSDYKSNWDPTNDYSREGLEKSDTFQYTQNIPLYKDGKLIYGVPYGGVPDEPEVTTVTTTAATTPATTSKTTAKTTTQPPSTTPDSLQTTPAQSGSVMYGDIDGNKKVELNDLTLLSQHLIGDIELTAQQLKAAEVTGDGNVDLCDIGHLKQYLLKEKVILGPQK
ncbi:MAG: glycoside hydrolase family 9 protein [Oscillospiraceae bacterium]|nr:glycoside hydrolase family 9 protein [Oscillospiraceae bacterium]